MTVFGLRGWIEKKKVEDKWVENGFVRVASVEEVPPGTGKVVVMRGREVGLFNSAGRFHAIDNICPHSYRPIGTLAFKGNLVTCLWHGLKFDVATGACPEAPHYRVQNYRVRVEAEDIFLAPPGSGSRV